MGEAITPETAPAWFDSARFTAMVEGFFERFGIQVFVAENGTGTYKPASLNLPLSAQGMYRVYWLDGDWTLIREPLERAFLDCIDFDLLARLGPDGPYDELQRLYPVLLEINPGGDLLRQVFISIHMGAQVQRMEAAVPVPV